MPHSVAGLIGKSLSAFSGARRKDTQTAYEELRKFDDFMLKDMGLTRFDVISLRRWR